MTIRFSVPEIYPVAVFMSVEQTFYYITYIQRYMTHFEHKRHKKQEEKKRLLQVLLGRLHLANHGKEGGL